MVDYWISSNIFTNNNINELLVKLKIDKFEYKKEYLEKVFPNYENPLLDEYETNIIRNFYDNPENIIKFYFIKDQKEIQNNN